MMSCVFICVNEVEGGDEERDDFRCVLICLDDIIMLKGKINTCVQVNLN